jgi:hypothetical protein
LREDPARLLADPVFLATTLPPLPLVEDPITCGGYRCAIAKQATRC